MDQLGDVLRRWLADVGTGDGSAQVLSRWHDLVGGDIASHTRAIEIERGTLIVSADHPGWIQILRTQERRVLSCLRRRHPELAISRISVVLSRGFDSRNEPPVQ